MVNSIFIFLRQTAFVLFRHFMDEFGKSVLMLRICCILALSLLAGCTTNRVTVEYADTHRANSNMQSYSSASSFSYSTATGLDALDKIQKPALDAYENSQYPMRNLAWNGTDKLHIDMPANIIFQKSDKPILEVRAPDKLLKATQFENGHLRLSQTSYKSSGQIPYTVIIRGPTVPQLQASLMSFIDLRDVQQEKLDIEMTGWGILRVTGQVKALTLNLSHQISADLSELHVENVIAHTGGTSQTKLRGSGAVHLYISDQASVTLYERPNTLKTTLDVYAKFYEKYAQ